MSYVRFHGHLGLIALPSCLGTPAAPRDRRRANHCRQKVPRGQAPSQLLRGAVNFLRYRRSVMRKSSAGAGGGETTDGLRAISATLLSRVKRAIKPDRPQG